MAAKGEKSSAGEDCEPGGKEARADGGVLPLWGRREDARRVTPSAVREGEVMVGATVDRQSPSGGPPFPLGLVGDGSAKGHQGELSVMDHKVELARSVLASSILETYQDPSQSQEEEPPPPPTPHIHTRTLTKYLILPFSPLSIMNLP